MDGPASSRESPDTVATPFVSLPVRLGLGICPDLDGDDKCRLNQAAVEDNIEEIRTLIRHGAQLHLYDPRIDLYYHCPLHTAASRGNYMSMNVLIASGAPIDAIDRTFKTPLQLATQHGHDEAV